MSHSRIHDAYAEYRDRLSSIPEDPYAVRQEMYVNQVQIFLNLKGKYVGASIYINQCIDPIIISVEVSGQELDANSFVY